MLFVGSKIIVKKIGIINCSPIIQSQTLARFFKAYFRNNNRNYLDQ